MDDISERSDGQVFDSTRTIDRHTGIAASRLSMSFHHPWATSPSLIHLSLTNNLRDKTMKNGLRVLRTQERRLNPREASAHLPLLPLLPSERHVPQHPPLQFPRPSLPSSSEPVSCFQLPTGVLVHVYLTMPIFFSGAPVIALGYESSPVEKKAPDSSDFTSQLRRWKDGERFCLRFFERG
jgi:hypothetical protein